MREKIRLKEDSRENVDKNKKVSEKVEAREYEDGGGNTLEKKSSVNMGGRGEQKVKRQGSTIWGKKSEGHGRIEVQEKAEDYEN